MRLIVAVLALALTAFGQTTPKRIPPEEAAKHLINKASATYPPLAEAARIQGNILLEVRIDESGAASVRRFIIGHPMLAPAAIESVNRWRYRPFDVDGKAATVVTLVMVTFGNPAKENDAAVRAEMLFQDSFWTAEESAEAASDQKDYVGAEQQLNRAKDILGPIDDYRRHQAERWRLMIAMGRLAKAEKKYDEAEQCYKNALELRQNDDKDAPEIAATLAELGRLYAEEERYDLARDHATRSVAIYQKNLKRVGGNASGARDVYGRAIAYQSWMLSRIALQQNDQIDAGKQCRTVLDFQTFLAAADHDSFVSACTSKD
jgi:tetratricopeptide (TPR) repeat protein